MRLEAYTSGTGGTLAQMTIGYYIICGGETIYSTSYPIKHCTYTDNNVPHIFAIIEAIEYVKENLKPEQLIVYTSSRNAVNKYGSYIDGIDKVINECTFPVQLEFLPSYFNKAKLLTKRNNIIQDFKPVETVTVSTEPYPWE